MAGEKKEILLWDMSRQRRVNAMCWMTNKMVADWDFKKVNFGRPENIKDCNGKSYDTLYRRHEI